MNKLPLYFLLLITLFSCNNGGEKPVSEPTPYVLKIPEGFPAMKIPEDNPLTVEGVALGRMLYYDKKLHKDGEKACATCHIQANSFTSGKEVLPAVNLGWSHNYLWNGKVHGTVEDIMRHEIENFFETNVAVLNSDQDYPALFKQAFDVDEITTEDIVKALAQFFRTMNSGNSS